MTTFVRDNEILKNLQAAAVAAGVKMTFTNMKVVLALYDYAQRCENAVSTDRWIRFPVTTVGLAEYCNVAPRMITDTLRKLERCGVVTYTAGRFRRSSVIKLNLDVFTVPLSPAQE